MKVKSIENRNRIISSVIALSMILTGISVLITHDASAAGPGTTPTLKCYGYQNFGAGDVTITDPITASIVEDPPYTDAIAPFNPQHAQAPVKDSITFNPAYISELDSDDELMGLAAAGPYLDQLKASGQDVNEKVFMRQWYEPWHWDKDVDGDGDMYGPWYDEELLHGEMQWLRGLSVHELQELGWLDEDDEIYPAIMQEYTYMYVEPLNVEDKPEPTFGVLDAGKNSLFFPMGIRQDSTYEYFWSPYGYGLSGIDANFDGEPDPTYIHSEKTIFGFTDIAADFDGNQMIDPLDYDGYQLSGDELLILTAGEDWKTGFELEKGARVQFLDHMIEVVDTFRNSRVIQGLMDPIPSVKLAIWYTGDLEPEFLGYQIIDQYDMALVGRKLPVTYIRSVENGGPGTNLCDFPTGPWFIYAQEVHYEEEIATIMVGRALGHTHTAMEDGQEEQDLQHGDPWWLKRFYVDGHEYTVVAIETIGNDVAWGAANTDWIGPSPPGTTYPLDPEIQPPYYFNDLDAAWAGQDPIWAGPPLPPNGILTQTDDGQHPDNPLVDNNEMESPDGVDLSLGGHGVDLDDLTRDETGFKFITIRTPIPKSGQRQNPATEEPAHEIVYTERYPSQEYSQQGASDSAIRNLGYYHLIEQHSIRLQPYFVCDKLSVLPPFSYEHTVLIDIQKNWSGIWDMYEKEWITEPEWIGPVKAMIPPITQTSGNYYTLDGRTITTEYMQYVDEDLNEQYKGELKEKLYEYSHAEDDAVGVVEFLAAMIQFPPNETQFPNEPTTPGGPEQLIPQVPLMENAELNEGWYVEQWNTLPDEYTEFILPAGGTYDEENPYLYLMTSSFWDVEAIGRILNQELGDDILADERFWDSDDIGNNGLNPYNDIPQGISDLFGDTLLDNRIDRDGPYFHRNMIWYFFLIYNTFPMYGSAWGGSYTDGIQYIDGNRVKFWFDPAPLTTETANDIKKYKTGDATETDGIRLYGFDSAGPGFIAATDPFFPDRDGDGDFDIIEYPPYTDPMAPFNPQSAQAPEKDSLTFDPAYMNEYEHGGEILSALYKLISIEESDAREKVFFRMWYEPWHWDKDCNSDGSPLGPDAIWLLDPDFQEVWYWPVAWLQGKPVPSESTKDGYVEEYAGQQQPELYGRGGGQNNWKFLDPDDEIHPALMQEFTYMYVNPYNMPDHGQPGTSRFAFPMGTTWDELWDCFGYGITTFDANFDGVEDICTVHSELSLSKHTGIQADFDGDGFIEMLDGDGLALSGDELVIFAVENINLNTGQSAMFLDNMVYTDTISGTTAKFVIQRTSSAITSCIIPYDVTTVNLEPGEMAIVRLGSNTVIPAGGNNLGEVDGAWFIYVESIDNSVSPTRCVVTMGRALGATFTAMDIGGDQVLDLTPGDPWYLKRFYVDGHEYNVVAIMTVMEEIRQAGGWANSKEECYEFKYITIRTQVPKVPVVIEQHSVRKQEYIPCSDGLDHFISVMPPFNYVHTCKEDIQAEWATTQEELEYLSDNNYKGDVIKAKPPVQIHIEEETRELQFKGELKEKYNKRPLVEAMTVTGWTGGTAADYSPAPLLSPITGFIDGRAVAGVVGPRWPWVDGPDEGLAQGCYHWVLWDDPGTADLTWYDSAQIMSTMYGKFQLMNDNGDGIWTAGEDEYWVMTVDYISYYWDPVLGRVVLNEDYLCFYAVDYNNDGVFYWYPDDTAHLSPGGIPIWPGEYNAWVDWETWMTEQWHTIPDLYTDISIDQGTDEDKYQLYMLTSSWYSDQSQLRIPYYEDGALSSNHPVDSYEFYVPDILFNSPFPVMIEIFLSHPHDAQTIELRLLDGNGNLLFGPAVGLHTNDVVISWPATGPGKYYVVVSINAPWILDLEPEPYDLYIYVHGQGARVKFWYDPENCDDIYVSTADPTICGGCTCYKGDYDKDCYIGPIDLTYLAAAWGSSCGDPEYTPCFDFDDDCDIDAVDLSFFASHWGEIYDCSACEGSCNTDWQPWPLLP